MPTEERRKHQRREYPGVQAVCYTADLPSTSNPYNHAIRLLDVGLGGVALLTFNKLNPGDEMIIDLHFQQHAARLKTRAVVKYSNEMVVDEKRVHRTGLSFIGDAEVREGRVNEAITGEKGKEEFVQQAPKEDHVERRRHTRQRIFAENVSVKPPGLLAGIGMVRNVGHALLDISRSGARLQMTSPLSKGERMKLRIHVPRIRDVLVTDAVVRWCEPDRGGPEGLHVAGFKFVDLPEKAEKLLDKLGLQ